MEAIEAILSRRSIRKYKSDSIPDHLVYELLKAAMSAPSASNKQPWHFVVIQDRAILDEIPNVHPYSAMLKEATLAIAVCGDPQLAAGKDWWVQDCSAATENILIAANALGLGAVWIGVYSNDERVASIRKVLALPQHILPLSLVSVGYPAERKPRSDLYDQGRVHQNKW
jgi:nitroreductase